MRKHDLLLAKALVVTAKQLLLKEDETRGFLDLKELIIPLITLFSPGGGDLPQAKEPVPITHVQKEVMPQWMAHPESGVSSNGIGGAGAVGFSGEDFLNKADNMLTATDNAHINAKNRIKKQMIESIEKSNHKDKKEFILKIENNLDRDLIVVSSTLDQVKHTTGKGKGRLYVHVEVSKDHAKTMVDKALTKYGLPEDLKTQVLTDLMNMR